MRILNIGSDKTLVGGKGVGDAVARHRQYGTHVESLDIIVYTQKADSLKEYYISGNVVGHPTNSLNKLTFLWDALKIAHNLWKEGRKFEVIVVQDPFVPALVGSRLKKKYGVKLQINFHGDFWNNPYWFRERWYNFLLLFVSKYTVPRADVVRVMSSGQKAKLEKAGIPANKIRIISTPVDIERFEKFEATASEEQKKLFENLKRTAEGRKMILMVGRKDKVKDFKTLCKAMNLVRKEIKNVGLWLVGVKREDSATVGGLMKLPFISEPVMAFITGVGGVESDDLPAYYYTSYLTVLPSKSESFGKVLVEANACGKPVVATATTGAREIIRDGYNGFLVPIGDYQTLAKKVLELLKNPELARQMGENGRNLVREKFGDNTAKIIGLWKELAQK